MFVVNGRTRCEGCYTHLGRIPWELISGPHMPCPDCEEYIRKEKEEEEACKSVTT